MVRKKLYKQYKLFFILIILILIIFSFFFLVLYPLYIQNIEDTDYKKFMAGGIESYPLISHGVTGEQDIIFNQIGELSPKKNVILLGGSTTRWGVLPEYTLPGNWTLFNFGMGYDTVYSDTVMLNYINTYANHKLNKNDVVIFHIYYGHFVEWDPKIDYTRNVIESSGIYSVDNSGKITGHMVDLEKQVLLKKFQINYFYSRAGSDSEQFIRNLVISNSLSENSSNNLNPDNTTPDEKKIQEFREYWIERTNKTTYPNNNTAKFEELIQQLNTQTNVVIVNLDTPSWIHNSLKEQEYETWLEYNLTPFLKKEKIPYLDFSFTIPDSEYRDSIHLSKNGREHYTALFNKDIKKYLAGLGSEV
jgi:hypothetical protein